MKCKHPSEYVTARSAKTNDRDKNAVSDDEDLPDIVFENVPTEEPVVDLTGQLPENDLFIDLMKGQDVNELKISAEPVEFNDVIITEEEESKGNQKYNVEILNFTEQDAFIPDRIYLESILGKLEHCSSDVEFKRTAIEISKTLKPLQPRKKNVRFRCNVDFIDAASTEAIPAIPIVYVDLSVTRTVEMIPCI